MQNFWILNRVVRKVTAKLWKVNKRTFAEGIRDYGAVEDTYNQGSLWRTLYKLHNEELHAPYPSLSIKYQSGDQIKENKMGGACDRR